MRWWAASQAMSHQISARVSFSRLFSWALLRFLNCLFLNVQLHKGQMKMVHKAAQAVRPAPHSDGDGTAGKEEQRLGQTLSWDQPHRLVGKIHCSLMTFSSCLMVLFLWGYL